MAFKSSNELRVEVEYRRGLLVPRAFRGDTEIQIKEMTQGNDGLVFLADLRAEVEAPIVPVPADVAALELLTPEEIAARHETGIQPKKETAGGASTAEAPAENSKTKAGK